MYKDITWLQNANLNASMSWDDSVAWADNLQFGGFDDWRLASMDRNLDDTIVDCSIVSEADCQDSELGYMYYHNLTGTLGDNLTGDQTVGDVTLLNISNGHWSGTEFAENPGLAWDFRFVSGANDLGVKLGNFGAWAVRDGDLGDSDSDSDGIFDDADNCCLISNADQRDTNDDAIGNACDPDLDNDCDVDFSDVDILKQVFLTSDPDADFDGNGMVDFFDVEVLKEFFLSAPGPSATGCIPPL